MLKSSKVSSSDRFKVQRAVMCKLLRKTPEELANCDFNTLMEVSIILGELGDKNPLMFL